MIPLNDDSSFIDALALVQDMYPDRPMLAVPARASRDYHPDGYEITYGEAARQIRELAAIYRHSGVGHGHRIALLLDNRPEHLLHKLALNTLGASSVPVNPEYRSGEISHLLNLTKANGAVCLSDRLGQMEEGIHASGKKVSLVTMETFSLGELRADCPAPLSGRITGQTEGSIQFTSGTTGRPKGCIMGQNYELMCGQWYATRGGLASLQEGERLYTPLPLYHCNALVYSFLRMFVTGGCQIQSDRFSPTRWWQEIRETEANIFHYLGVMISLLMDMPASKDDKNHSIRFAIGAGVEADLHKAFEERFGLPLLEQWGMTEITRCYGDYHPPRKVGTRSFGRPVKTLEARVVDDNDVDVPTGMRGELVVRHSEETPRKHFFGGYLFDPETTEKAWQGGWFHSGDIVEQDEDGTLHFVERKKNIIRRSGENIAPAEVESILMTHENVRQAAILAVKDEAREEEVLACISLKGASSSHETAQKIVNFCLAQLAYYKAPGWVYFLDELPTTGTMKVQKHQLFAKDVDPRTSEGIHDLREMKKRQPVDAKTAK
jgi:acyl-CoA synthetase (AMP-forming)/AMP-acid ligase II